MKKKNTDHMDQYMAVFFYFGRSHASFHTVLIFFFG
jgi:hypothetical protein